MAVEKQMIPDTGVKKLAELEEQLEIEIENPDSVSIGTEDGGVVIDFEGNKTEELLGAAHDSNLAEYLEDAALEELSSELIENFNTDRQSRGDWAKSYVKGLDLLGMKIEERQQPWSGASGVFHPVLTESIVRFQAQAMGEIFPAAGPVRTKTVGKQTREKTEQAARVENEMNYLLTEEMTEYRDETEQMLFKLPLAGSAFKKVYYDPLLERPCAMFVPAEDFVVSYGATDLMSCIRYTHVMKKTANEIAKLMVNGFYKDLDLPDPEPDFSDIQEKYDELDGESATIEDDDRHTLLEIHADLELPEPFQDKEGIARPYVVTIDKSSKMILSIRRNYYEDDEKKKKIQYFVHYKYLPGLGFYGTGLIHLIGGLAKSATSILRQLIDAGTLSNLPAGLKARGLRIKGDDSPLMPGEFRDVDVPGGAIRDAITFIPYKEPSSVLYQLLQNIVDEGRRIGSVADIQVGDINSQAPVGTTLALMERSMKVMSGVQSRLHSSLKKELRLIANIIHDYMPSEYIYEIEGEFSRTKDFDDRVDVIPVSDPNAATMSQRIMQYQAALQLAQQAPQLYDMGKLHRQMLEVLGITDAKDIVKLKEDIKPNDPVTENMMILKQEPVKAFKYQDHEAHITEHVAFQYRKEMELKLGVPMPSEEKPLPEDAEAELSRLTAQAAQKLLSSNEAEMQAQAAKKAQEDPLTIIQQRELAIKEAELQHKIEMDKLKLELETAKTKINKDLQEDRLESEDKREGVRIAAKLATDASKDQKEEAKLVLDAAKQLQDE